MCRQGLNREGNPVCVYKFSRTFDRASESARERGWMKKLELNKETLRDLTEVDLSTVSGGRADAQAITTSQSPVCPSGATWLMACDSYHATCG